MLLGYLAGLLGVAEPALRLLITILAGYPVAWAHRKYFFGQDPVIQHLFFFASGFLLGFYNFGISMFHTTANMLAVYLILKVWGGTFVSAVAVMALNMSYLLIGYIVTETEGYDIVWTMPHCVLVLRLSGLAFDIYDGAQPEEKLSKESKQCAIKSMPSLLEVAGYTYFPTAFLVGPQFPLTRYRALVEGRCKNEKDTLPDCEEAAKTRAFLGFTYLILYTVLSVYYPTEYLISEEFENLSYIRRITVCGVWAHFTFYKYLSCWLISEGSCILIGISYNGEDEKGRDKWDGCKNVDVYLFETAQTFSHDYVHSFNINTNNWVLQYVYKRLKFLGNKNYSQGGVLLFLALWHGFHSGYYMTFMLEFASLAAEKDFEVILKRNGKFLEWLEKPGISQIKWVVLKYYTVVVMGPCLAPFALRSWDKWLRLHKTVWFLPHVVWIGYYLYRPVLKALLPPKPKAQ